MKNQEKAWWVLGDLYTFKATGQQTQGKCTVIEQLVQPQSGPPSYIHHREDEAFYVLAGTFSFLCGDRETVYEAGSFVYVPKGTLHTFRNIEAQQGRLLVMITPAGLEEFFYSIGTPATDLTSPPAFDPADIDKLMALADTYQMEIHLPGAK